MFKSFGKDASNIELIEERQYSLYEEENEIKLRIGLTKTKKYLVIQALYEEDIENENFQFFQTKLTLKNLQEKSKKLCTASTMDECYQIIINSFEENIVEIKDIARMKYLKLSFNYDIKSLGINLLYKNIDIDSILETFGIVIEKKEEIEEDDNQQENIEINEDVNNDIDTNENYNIERPNSNEQNEIEEINEFNNEQYKEGSIEIEEINEDNMQDEQNNEEKNGDKEEIKDNVNEEEVEDENLEKIEHNENNNDNIEEAENQEILEEDKIQKKEDYNIKEDTENTINDKKVNKEDDNSMERNEIEIIEEDNEEINQEEKNEDENGERNKEINEENENKSDLINNKEEEEINIENDNKEVNNDEQLGNDEDQKEEVKYNNEIINKQDNINDSNEEYINKNINEIQEKEDSYIEKDNNNETQKAEEVDNNKYIEEKNELNDKINELLKKISSLEKEKKNLIEENSSLKEENIEFKNKIISLEKENTSWKSENNSLKNENANYKKENENLKKDNNDLKNEINILKKKITKANLTEDKLRKSNKEKNDLKIELQKLRNEKSKKNSQEKNQMNKNKDLGNNNKTLRRYQTDMKFKVHPLKKEKNEIIIEEKKEENEKENKNTIVRNIKNEFDKNSNFQSKAPINLKISKTLTQSSYITYSIDKAFDAFTTLSGDILLVYATKIKSIECFDLVKQKYTNTVLNAHTSMILIIRYYCPIYLNQDLILSSSNTPDYCIKIWDLYNWSCIYNLNNIYDKGNMLAVCLHFDEYQKESYIFTSNDFGYIKIWGIDGKFIKNVNKSENNETYFLDTYYDDTELKYFLITGELKCTKSYELNTHQLFRTYLDTNSYAEHVSAFVYKNMDITELVECEFYGYIRIWNFHSGNLIKKIEICKRVPLVSMCLWNKNYLLISCVDYTIKLVDFKNYAFIKSFRGHNNEVCTIKKIIHPTYGECLISQGLSNDQIKMWVND